MTTHYLIRSSVALGVLMVCTASALPAAELSHAALKAEANVPEAQAWRTALAQVPGGTIKSAELERERGKLIWSFDVAMPGSQSITEVQVDAKAGNVVSTAIETPAAQAKEATADRKNAKRR